MDAQSRQESPLFKWQVRLQELLDPDDGEFLGKIIDMTIIVLIVLNAFAVIIETVPDLHRRYNDAFRAFEYFSIGVFSVEYVCRLWAVTVLQKYQHPLWGRLRFAATPLMIIDLLAILPFYLPFILGANYAFINYLRYFRMLRLLKLTRYMHSLRIMGDVVRQKSEELVISLVAVMFLLVIASCFMFFIEHEAQPEKFSSIPETMWWGVATLTTVGYGDVYPVTGLGKFLGAIIAVLGIGLFALPAGILASGFSERLDKSAASSATCEICGAEIKIQD